MNRQPSFRPHFALGIRLQLTIWYTAIFALILLLGGGILYIRLQDSLNTSLDTALQLRAQQITGDIRYLQGQVVLEGAARELPGFDTKDNHPTSRADVNFDTLVRLLDLHGHVLHSSPAFQELDVPSASILQPQQGTPWQGDVTATNGQLVRVYSRTVADDGQVFGIIQVGQSLVLLQNILQNVTTQLLIGITAGLLLGALGSYWLAKRAFAPIRQLIEVSRTIKAGNLQQRVPIPQATDEVYALATTLNDMLASLEITLNRQRRFISDASHELRTPVTVIRSKTDLALQQPCEQEEYVHILRAINDESVRLGHLISDLLALARGDEEKTRFEMEKVPLHVVAEAVVANAEPLALERDITLHINTSEPVVVYGDEARLIQVIMNLLDNAIQYTETGGQITVCVENRQTSARLTVRDTGIGIPADQLAHVFERFYRVDPARTHNEGSHNGLGLSIVEWLVNAHKGTIAVESQLGQGTTFIVTLPLYRSERSYLPRQK